MKDGSITMRKRKESFQLHSVPSRLSKKKKDNCCGSWEFYFEFKLKLKYFVKIDVEPLKIIKFLISYSSIYQSFLLHIFLKNNIFIILVLNNLLTDLLRIIFLQRSDFARHFFLFLNDLFLKCYSLITRFCFLFLQINILILWVGKFVLETFCWLILLL